MRLKTLAISVLAALIVCSASFAAMMPGPTSYRHAGADKAL